MTRKIRDAAHAGGIADAFRHLRHVMVYGYEALRRPSKAKPKQREVVVRYFILHGIVTALGQVRETLNLLTEVEPSLKSVVAPFEPDLKLWTRFRDDAAHIVDRTHRTPMPNDNDAVVGSDQYGYDSDVLAYDEAADIVRTGLTHTMVLRSAIQRAEEIMSAVIEAIAEGYRAKTIQPPPRYRNPN
jgi:hypothetical protein